MKSFLHLVSLLLVIVGIIWILQGANILPGSFMTGQPEWLLAGIICVVMSAGIQMYIRRNNRI